MVLYDEYGIPAPQYAYDGSVQRLPIPDDMSAVKDNLSNDSDAYAIDIRLVNRSRVTPFRDIQQTTEIDIVDVPKGYALFRRVHPTHDSDRVLRCPQVTLLSRANCSSKTD